MTEEEWLVEQRSSGWLVHTLLKPGKLQRTKAGKRKLRLLACGCCRLIGEVWTDPRLRRAVEVAEQFADGLASKEELHEVHQIADGLASKEELHKVYQRYIQRTNDRYNSPILWDQNDAAAHLALSATMAQSRWAAVDMTALPLHLAGFHEKDHRVHSRLCQLLRCVFGNPFRPVTVIPGWQSATVTTLARGIYEEYAFDRLPILADYLEEEGCTNPEILNHCRQPGEHIRGCWVVDHLRGKGVKA